MLLDLLAMLRDDIENEDEGGDDDGLGVTTVDLNDLQNLHEFHDNVVDWDDLEDPEAEPEDHEHTHEH